jgi:hypothetical protein
MSVWSKVPFLIQYNFWHFAFLQLHFFQRHVVHPNSNSKTNLFEKKISQMKKKTNRQTDLYKNKIFSDKIPRTKIFLVGLFL